MSEKDKEVTLDEIKEDATDKHMSKIIVLSVNQLGEAKNSVCIHNQKEEQQKGSQDEDDFVNHL